MGKALAWAEVLRAIKLCAVQLVESPAIGGELGEKNGAPWDALLASEAMTLARSRPGLPRKGRPAALGASPCPQRAALRERGEGAKRHRGGHFIAVSEPMPLGVLMLAQVPAGTYFQALPW